MSAYIELLADLEAEYQSLLALLRPLDEAAWDLATPAEGWAVRDQISHLAYFDDAAREAVTDGDAFLVFVADAIEKGGDPMEEHLVRGRAISGSAVLAWFEQAHEGLSGALDGLDPSARVPWFGPAMGVMSFVSARLMETWAHGQDVADALGAERTPTARLRHIAHLGVRARPYSYVVRGMDVPAGRIDVVLVGPDGDEWSWVVGEDGGSGDGGDGGGAGGVVGGGGAASVRGNALEFGLVVTQRRNVDDTSLEVTGGLATEWLQIAQAFAGPAGPGRAATGS